MTQTSHGRSTLLLSLLITGLLMNFCNSFAFSATSPRTQQQALRLTRSEGQGGGRCITGTKIVDGHGQLKLGERTRQSDPTIARRDILLRAVGLALGVTSIAIANPAPAAAFFDYEGERTDYTYRPPPPPVGISSTSRDATTSSLPGSVIAPESNQSAEARLPPADESSPGLRDYYLLQSTSADPRTKDYQRLEEPEDEFVYSSEPQDHYDGMYF